MITTIYGHIGLRILFLVLVIFLLFTNSCCDLLYSSETKQNTLNCLIAQNSHGINLDKFGDTDVIH